MSQETEFEYEVKTFNIDEGFQNKMGDMLKEGWVPVQGIKPVAVFHVIRPRVRPEPGAGGAMAVIRIDESKVFITRGDTGNIEDKDGNVVGNVNDPK